MKRVLPITLVLIICCVVFIPALAQTEIADSTEPLWDGQSRFTILVTGLDRRPIEFQSLNYRTDTIMILSFDPATQQIGVLSIPRDMHIAVPESGELIRVNTLFVRGERQGVGRGPEYMVDVMQYNFGIYIDAYVAFDFEAFQTIIDTIGGITIDVPYAISDSRYPDMNWLFDPFWIGAGVQTLDGETALKYARTRLTDSDYRRGERQLLVMMGIRNQLDNEIALQQMLVRAPQLLQDLDGHIYTNISIDQAIPVGLAMMQVPAENIQTGALGLDYSYNWAGVRVPDREKLIGLMTETFGENYGA